MITSFSDSLSVASGETKKQKHNRGQKSILPICPPCGTIEAAKYAGRRGLVAEATAKHKPSRCGQARKTFRRIGLLAKHTAPALAFLMPAPL